MYFHTFIWNNVVWHREVLNIRYHLRIFQQLPHQIPKWYLLNMTHFQLFAWFAKILLVKKILKKKLNSYWCTPLHPKSILNDQVGSGSGLLKIFRGTYRHNFFKTWNMIANDDFYGKELNLNCFYMHTIFGQKYSKPALVYEDLYIFAQVCLQNCFCCC